MRQLDEGSAALMRDLEHRMRDNTFCLAEHAHERDLRMGNPNFLHNILAVLKTVLLRREDPNAVESAWSSGRLHSSDAGGMPTTDGRGGVVAGANRTDVKR